MICQNILLNDMSSTAFSSTIAMLSQNILLNASKIHQNKILLTNHTLSRLIKPKLQLGLNSNTYFGNTKKSEKITVTFYHLI
jgi:hypothetical protein